MKKLILTLLSCSLGFAETTPLKALLIAGGCCHDYANQHQILSHGLQQRANMRVDVIWTPNSSANPPLDLYKNPDWAKGYDLIIHDECAAANTNEEVISNIINAHQSIPAVFLHCAMHSFRGKSLNWEKYIGLVSRKHGPHEPIDVDITAPDHPIMKGLENWHIAKDELYHVQEMFGAEPLALGRQAYSRGGEEIVDEHVVAWTNTKAGAPSFSTSLGHYNDVVKSEQYLTLVTRGSLWACGKLDDPAFMTPYKGENTITEIASPLKPVKVKLSASSTEAGKGNYIHHVLDGKEDTRWCSANGKYPATLELELASPQNISALEIMWEFPEKWMQYTIETSANGTDWKNVFDHSTSGRTGIFMSRLKGANDVKHIKINALKQQNNMWASIREIKVFHANGDRLPLIHEGAELLK